MTSPDANFHPSPLRTNPYSDLVQVMAQLRGPEGCPWDREQTAETLKPYLIEETYEVLEAIDGNEPEALKDELADLLLQVLFHSQIASENHQFTFEDVVRHLSEKLIRRHPHVFSPTEQRPQLHTSQEVKQQWDRLKQKESSNGQASPSILQGIPRSSPALQRAYQVQKRASRSGFDWHTIEPVLEKFQEELQELYRETAEQWREHSPDQVGNQPHTRIEEELGDVLFSVVNLSRFLRANPEEALRKTTNRFIKRFEWIEAQALAKGKTIQDCSPEELDDWWEMAKVQTHSDTPNSPPNQDHPT